MQPCISVQANPQHHIEATVLRQPLHAVVTTEATCIVSASHEKVVASYTADSRLFIYVLPHR